jgi:SAM-dependent methyltransferase
MEKMYSITSYHDIHYSECDIKQYVTSAKFLKKYATPGTTVLDYGCGVGHFLKAIKNEGFKAFGVEFDASAAKVASVQADCVVTSDVDLDHRNIFEKFDVIHLGDVLEHTADPKSTIDRLLGHLKSGGLLYVEGPLERNPSPVYFASQIFGKIRFCLNPEYIGSGTPTHLFFTDGIQQLDFFNQFKPDLVMLRWHIYETGWPYSEGGVAKRAIARLAIILSGKKIGGFAFGNRFTAIFRYRETDDRTK